MKDWKQGYTYQNAHRNFVFLALSSFPQYKIFKYPPFTCKVYVNFHYSLAI